MAKPTQTDRSGKAGPTPVDDPLAQLIDKLSDEVEPVATTPEVSEVEAPAPPLDGDTATTA
jgi:hypothetical protein